MLVGFGGTELNCSIADFNAIRSGEFFLKGDIIEMEFCGDWIQAVERRINFLLAGSGLKSGRKNAKGIQRSGLSTDRYFLTLGKF